METTEKKFKQWCNKNNYFCKKLLTHTSTGHGGRQEADFLVTSNEKVFMVECKERSGDLFMFNDLTQLRKLNILIKKTKLIKPLILINFVKHKTLLIFSLDEYLKIKKSFEGVRKSINVKKINDKYKYTWKNLIIK